MAKKDLLRQSINFISKNILDIILVVLILFSSLSYMIVHGITIEKTKPKLKKVVIFENFAGINDDPFSTSLENGFCKYQNSQNDPDKSCNKLDQKQCSDINCCIFDKINKKCVGATNGKPTIISQ